MKATCETVIDTAANTIDLGEWARTLTDAEYRRTARGHQAVGTFIDNGVLGMVNVENVGGYLMVQHYRATTLRADRVEMYSPESTAYVAHLAPVKVQVRWTMELTARDE